MNYKAISNISINNLVIKMNTIFKPFFYNLNNNQIEYLIKNGYIIQIDEFSLNNNKSKLSLEKLNEIKNKYNSLYETTNNNTSDKKSKRKYNKSKKDID